MDTRNKSQVAGNGVAKLPNVQNQENSKNDLDKAETQIKAMLSPTAEQRILNLKNLNLLSEKYEQLKDKQDELNRFTVSNDGTEEYFKLSNNGGVVFQTSNSALILEVTEVIGKHLDNGIKKVEKEILDFTV